MNTNIDRKALSKELQELQSTFSLKDKSEESSRKAERIKEIKQLLNLNAKPKKSWTDGDVRMYASYFR